MADSPLGALIRSSINDRSIRDNRRTVRGKLKPYSVYQLARETGINEAYISRVMRGIHTSMSRPFIIKICKVLGCSPARCAEIFNAAGYSAPTDSELSYIAAEQTKDSVVAA